MIRTFLFDMGNVLVHFSHERMCQQMADVCGTSAAAMRSLLFETGLLAQFERGRLTEIDLHQRLEAHFGGSFDPAAVRRAGSDIFSLNGSILPVLDALRSNRYRLVLLSNTSVSHLNWVRQQWDVLDRFDRLVTSYEAGAIKPEPPIFEAALEAANCAPSECFYTDDVPAYVTAARGYGIDGEVFVDTPDLLNQLARRGISLDLAGF